MADVGSPSPTVAVHGKACPFGACVLGQLLDHTDEPGQHAGAAGHSGMRVRLRFRVKDAHLALDCAAPAEKTDGEPAAKAGAAKAGAAMAGDAAPAPASDDADASALPPGRLPAEKSMEEAGEEAFDEEFRVWLAHKVPLCPAAAFARSGAARRDKSLRIGVAVLLESADGRVLLTRRQAHLRSFPGLLVLPGGNLDPGESLVSAGLRELAEETGVRVTAAGKDPCRVLCLWESTYPLTFDATRGSDGITHHHLVVYVLVKSATLLSHDYRALRPQISEVAELAWVSREQARAVAHALDPATLSDAAQRVHAFRPDAGEFDRAEWEKKTNLSAESRSVAQLDEVVRNTVIGTRFALRCYLAESRASPL